MIRCQMITGVGPRYRLYATKDGRMLAVGALEQKFWDAFCDLINLEHALRDDAKDPGATAARVAGIVASDTAATWARRIEGPDCCCSIVATVDQAAADPHFVARAARHDVPIDPDFRK